MDLLVLVLLVATSMVISMSWRYLGSRRKHLPEYYANEKSSSITPESDPYRNIEPLHNFDWTKKSPIRSALLKPKYHLTMALENISLSDIIDMDNTYIERLRIRRQIMSQHPDATVRCNPVCEPVVLELYSWLIATYLPKRYPTIYKLGPKGLHNTASDEMIPMVPSSPREALHVLGFHIDTDFLLLLPSSKAADGSSIYHLEAFVTCFPSGFSTQSKLGLPLSHIHSPVPGYREKLQKSMDRFFARLECGKAVKRSNWAITTNDLLFGESSGSHFHHEASEDDIARQRNEVVIENCRLRSERQTLFRLPETKALVFSFKTFQYTLEEVRKDGFAEDLIVAMEGLSKGNVPEMDFYKRGVVWREPVRDYLRN